MLRVLVRKDIVDAFKDMIARISHDVDWDLYEGEDYRDKVLAEKWDVIFGEKIFEMDDTVFVQTLKELELALKYVVNKKEYESLRAKYNLLLYTPELQGAKIKETLFQIQKFYNSYSVFALVSERGIHRHAYVDFVTGGNYLSLIYHEDLPINTGSHTIFIDNAPPDFHPPRFSGEKVILGMDSSPKINIPFITIPPLRERKMDIPYMLDGVLRSLQLQGKTFKIDDGLIKLLTSYHWPGNTQEFLEKTYEILTLKDSAEQVKGVVRNLKGTKGIDLKKFVETVVEFVERRMIEKALEESEGNRKKACEILNMNYKTLSYKIKKYGLG
ncbi:helix-turn-helix domain-containing protein [Thermotoga sp.]|uniref:helix-turn-helix domain-containing protein n=1 Tax=Thermotoga sp. TaxID=28240 RepID=UPI0025FE2568|nr:helix-turn-helix domain-containing protein [Thermotoga sp.]MCD6550928.1 Fis family transcriptional regulator [Thermotoga sp.]